MPWFFMVALLGYGRRYLSAAGRDWFGGRRSRGFAGRFLRYADEASYPVYLLHQTVIVAVAFLVVRVDAGAGVKFVAVLFGSLLATVLLYELVVRRVGVTRFLFGMKPLRRAVGDVAQRPAGVMRRTAGTEPIGDRGMAGIASQRGAA